MRLRAVVVKPLVLKLLLFPVKISTALYPWSAASDGNACVHGLRYVKLTPSPVRALVYTDESSGNAAGELEPSSSTRSTSRRLRSRESFDMRILVADDESA